eukprot:14345922-Alexandrium_andersonii.AAC.1
MSHGVSGWLEMYGYNFAAQGIAAAAEALLPRAKGKARGAVRAAPRASRAEEPVLLWTAKKGRR